MLNAHAHSIFAALDEELLLYIFTFLDAKDVLKSDECCKSWSRTVRDPGADRRLWRSLWTSVIESCRRADVVKNVPTESTGSRVRMLSAAALRRALADNHVDTSRCVEMNDYRAMLLANIVFGARRSGSAPVDRRRNLIFYPEWALRLGDWKASYFHLIHDLVRSNLKKSELCSFKWRFKFKPDFVHTPFDPDDMDAMDGVFNEDFTYRSGTTLAAALTSPFTEYPYSTPAARLVGRSFGRALARAPAVFCGCESNLRRFVAWQKASIARSSGASWRTRMVCAR